MNISNGELRLMEIIWEHAPIKSGELVARAFSGLGWKKSTVYTVVKKLTQKGVIKSEDALITPLVTRSEVMKTRSGELISTGYSGSLPMFLTSFLNGGRLSRAEAEELKKLIDDYTDREEK